MSIELAMISTHTPRMCHEEKVADFQKPLLEAMHKASERMHEMNPDVVVIISTHWMASFNHFVDATPKHEGILTSMESPELISDVPYNYPGDPELAEKLVEAGKNNGLPVELVNDETYVWDYGTVVPLRYLIPNENLPVIDLSVNWSASLEESYQWGLQIGTVLRESEKRAVFVSSGALSHNMVRGPEKMPTLAEQALDNQFIQYMLKSDFAAAKEMLPQFSRSAGVESGGRHLAVLLGVLEGSYQGNFQGTFLAYGPSSGTGNAIVTFDPS
ncbi:extradiol ring-cleavage dioxygenase [Fictibacillus enclensis]|uniref:DODA-type extradiol aromatic ring-opening family dioxygenase n=1 Tax=Fictibacillus enclensis TaxID=1017270 RepID=UPI0025A1FA74|nr:extradiol ring-cleavage dioxygenase [Fictibacillus enclensis]MDM5196693.1 extradiol ring-cleavage dioxygenase [Fictibacillus enclensis]